MSDLLWRDTTGNTAMWFMNGHLFPSLVSHCSAVTLGRRSAPMAFPAHQGAIGQT
jgi:hypothetical protein